MSELNHVRNPFMLMTHPEMVLAALERSERLDRHNRRLCRPLDRPGPDESAPAASTRRPEGLPAQPVRRD